jgi:colicin import membrane protein
MTTTDLVEYVSANPVAVLTDEKKYSEFFARVQKEIADHKPCVETPKGRKEIASLAYKIARSKTAIDDAGKKLNEEARKKINAVDEQRRKIRGELEELSATVRKPLTEWEEAEEARQAQVAARFDHFHIASQVMADEPSEAVAARLEALTAETLDPDVFRDRHEEAVKAHAAAVDRLREAKDRLLKQEADAAELARLRAEQEARDEADRLAKEKEEAARAEAERKEREAAEAKRREDEAAENARQEVLREAEAERKRQEAEIARLEAEKKAAAEKAAREERERAEAAAKQKAEDDKRAADREHRGKVMGEAKAAIMGVGVDEDAAKKIVLAIVAGEVPHVTLRF